jgi:hypothetical protein
MAGAHLPLNLHPQLSERWVMYRLVCPLVDISCERSGLEPYFEYAQPNGPNSSIKVDIALLSQDCPIWYIEAKKYARAIHPEMVLAYLHDDVMGAVSNGNYWVFVIRGRTCKVGPILDASGAPLPALVEQVVELLACRSPEEALNVGEFTGSPVGLVRNLEASSVQRRSGGKGTRVYAVKTTYTSLTAALNQALSSCLPGSTTEYYLRRLRAASLEVSGGILEVSDNRLIWQRRPQDRLARINLKSRQLEILIAAEVTEWIGAANIAARLKIHNKNPNMRQAFAPDPASADSLLPVFRYPVTST